MLSALCRFMVWNKERPVTVNLLAIALGLVAFPVIIAVFVLSAFVAAIFGLALG